MPVDVKICGLMTAPAVDWAVEAGAALVGFVFFPPSPRSLAPEAAAPLIAAVPPPVTPTALVVDADDAWLDAVVAVARPRMLQLHGKETPERVAQVKARYGLPVMKAWAVAEPADVQAARAYEGVADRLLFDAKPPKGATRPGGNALAFDWALLAGTSWAVPWMLAGGLEPGNVAQAVAVSGARAVDVSSGVEDAPGVKNLEKIRAFLAAVKGL
ncbi:MAG: phosphoribosylanthranilate isomerase [Rhodobacterales bacterium]|nr:phosphoribosylanthranilate isomerase [Rhodobacterales bacterium]